MRTKFAIALMELRAVTGISFYKLGDHTGVTGPTISKWLKPVGHKHHRNPTEEQVLKIFSAVAFRNEPPDRIHELLEVDGADFMRLLDALRERAQLSWCEVAERSNLGQERMAEFLGGGVLIPAAARLRMVIVARCTPARIALANRLLQAANFYVLRAPPEVEEGAA